MFKMTRRPEPIFTSCHLINLICVLLIQLVQIQQDGKFCVGQGSPSKQPYYGTLIGRLNRRGHDVSGDVFAVDEQTLFIKNFNYDGLAPDAYFWSSVTSPLPSPDGFIVPDEKGSTKPLERYINKNVVLRLPEGKTLREIRWISIWCRQMKLNFGELAITRNLVIPQPIEISSLSQLAHGVRSGPITIIDAQTFLVSDFSYDGLGPAAYFWLTRSSLGLSGTGLRLKDENGSAAPLHKYNGETVVISLPEDYTIYDFDYFGVWSKEYQVNYGQTRIPQTAKVPPSPKMLGIKPENKLNCEILYDDLGYEIRWVLDGDDIVMQLVGKIEPGEYMAFGLGKDDARSDMTNADATVTWVDRSSGQVHAVDYFLSSKEQCVGNRGSCPDVKFDGGSDSLTLLHGAIVNGYSMVTFKRPQLGIDELYDQHVYSDGQQSIIWAIGSLNERSEVAYHRLKTRGDTFIDFARTPQWNCPNPDLNATINHQPIPAASQNEPTISAAPNQPSALVNRQANDRVHALQSTSVTTVPSILVPTTVASMHLQGFNPSTLATNNFDQTRNEQHNPQAHASGSMQQIDNNNQLSQSIPWSIAPIVCPADQKFVAQIGPTGGLKGYQGITGHHGWGITWFINGQMIPELVVQRGKTYKFIVEGGSSKTSSTRRHPLYITDSPEGGFDYKTDLERRNERIFAGVGVRTDGQFVPTATGRLCEWKSNDSMARSPDSFDDFQSFKSTLRLDCDPGQPSILKWTPDTNTPDVVYYQCYTHRYLGWRIRVVDSCDSLNSKNTRHVTSRMDLEMAGSNIRYRTNESVFYTRRSQQTEPPSHFDGATNDLFSFEQNNGNNITPDSSNISNFTINTYNDMAALLAANNITTDANTSFDDVLALSQTNLENFLENPGTKSNDFRGNSDDDPSLMQQISYSNQLTPLMTMDQSQSQINRPKPITSPSQGIQSYVARLAQLYYPMPHLSAALASLLNTSHSHSAQQQQHQQQTSSLNLKPSTNTMASSTFSLSQFVPRPKIDLISPVLKIPRLRLKSSRKYESINKPSQPPTPATEFNYNIFNNHIANLNNQQKLGHAPWPAGLPTAMFTGESNIFENNPSAQSNNEMHVASEDMPNGLMNFNSPPTNFVTQQTGQNQQKKPIQNNLSFSTQINNNEHQKLHQQYMSSISQPSMNSEAMSTHGGINRNNFKFYQSKNNPVSGHFKTNADNIKADQHQTTDPKDNVNPFNSTPTAGRNIHPYTTSNDYLKQSSNDINLNQQSHMNGLNTIDNLVNQPGQDKKIKSNEQLNYDQADSILYDTFSFLGHKGHPNLTKMYQQQFQMDNNNMNLITNPLAQTNQIPSSTTSGWLNPKIFSHQQASSPYNYMNVDTNQQSELSNQKHFPLLINSLFNSNGNSNSNSNHNPSNKYHTNQQSSSVAKPSLTKLWFTSSPFRGSGMSMMQQAASNLASRHPSAYRNPASSLFLRQKPQHFPYTSNSPPFSLSKLPFAFSSMLTNSNEHHTNHIAMPQQQHSQQQTNQMQHTNLNQDASPFQPSQIQPSTNTEQISHSFAMNTEPNHVPQQLVNSNPHLNSQTNQHTQHQATNSQQDSGGSGGPDYMMAVERFSKQSSESRPSSIVNPVNGQPIIFHPTDLDNNRINLHSFKNELTGQKMTLATTDKELNSHPPYFLMMKSSKKNHTGLNEVKYQQITSEDGKMIARLELPKPFEFDYLPLAYLNNSSSQADLMNMAVQQDKQLSTADSIPSTIIYYNNSIKNNDLVTKQPLSISYRPINVTNPAYASADNNTNVTYYSDLDTTQKNIMWNSSKINSLQPITESVLMTSLVLPSPINYTRDFTSTTLPTLNNIHLSSYNTNSEGRPFVPLEKSLISSNAFLDPRYQINSVYSDNKRPNPPVRVASTIASHISDSASRSIKNFLSSTPGSSGSNFIVLDSSPNDKMTSQAQLRPKYIGRFLNPHMSAAPSSHSKKNANIDDRYKIIGHQFDRLSSLSSPPSTSIALDPMIAAHSIPSIISGQLIGFASPDGQSLLTRQPKIAHSNESFEGKDSKPRLMLNLLNDIALGDTQHYLNKNILNHNVINDRNKYNHKLIDDRILTKYIPKLMSSTARPTISTYYIKDKSPFNTTKLLDQNTNNTSIAEQKQILKELNENKLFNNSINGHQTTKVPQITLTQTDKAANLSTTQPSDNDTDRTILSHVLSLISTNAVAPPVVSVASSPDARFWSDSLNQRYDFIDYEINRRKR